MLEGLLEDEVLNTSCGNTPKARRVSGEENIIGSTMNRALFCLSESASVESARVPRFVKPESASVMESKKICTEKRLVGLFFRFQKSYGNSFSPYFRLFKIRSR